MRCPQAINQPLPANWQEKHDRMLFQRDILEARRKQLKLQPFWSITRSSSWLIKRPRRRGNWAAISARVGNFAKPSAVLTRTATELVTKRTTFRYSDGSSHRSCFPVPFPEYVFHVEEAEVQERLNCSLPVSMWINIFQLPLKIWS